MSRPRKDSTIEREPKHEPKHSVKMREAPNWESVDLSEEDHPDRQRIPAHLIPEGMSFQWVTDTVLGQSFAQHRASFEKKGWTPVHQEDFDGQLDGMFMKRGEQGEIRMSGQVLMARPSELTDRARKRDRRLANEQVAIKEQALRGGDLPGVSLDTSHPSVVGSNRINKSVERLVAPEEISRPGYGSGGCMYRAHDGTG